MSIYGDIILDHYHYPRNFKKLNKSSKKVHVDNPLCGDSIDLAINVKDDHVQDIAFQGQGCAISLASASLLTEYVKGKKISEVKNIDTDSVLKLLNIELSPNRIKCALLPWEAFMKLMTN
ncbi:SUF system NifU family Fe-S cluster assembly protein [Candidatus Roizmanbacteria bacterium RIFCSPLOWO2_01_FULL_38_12]|uniref:SUF system NifU family Fe-S cluster assembly protein n=1 Tax=Candidatus Roizmanbacteria bacterium RIFCSPLOWO2_01_FULL_38_12 TaxID=1802061 RepID=A0A1F7IWB4_9BACT|nr:MAG: SUF system NifU family Fe-S cluster assembly protein [Candidatus Roizmanbacteria bacterium RIFCSPHIGHO2_01_FULL_38_15]OGK35591.1 MAG: SUF system NifU family Fe-S cluster assembly protein [Candidatus Roizmanbacteria bacterium RIFCSPHIGHO2_12_FULL_38_13]OGK47667.1 MAG: SUF system NifU family Fe-S cluster assembly protein [Candidatus Roizmanbacteria bacterium RIFCSPLOWO2_01_FULL_38_12]